jgi:signal peptidase
MHVTAQGVGHAGPLVRSARLARGTATLALALGIVAWLALLRPTALGGSSTYVIVSGDSMLPLYQSGDLIIAQPDTASGPYAAVGSVVVFRIRPGEPGAGRLIVHRIVAFDPAIGYSTKGDHNPYLDPWHPRPEDVVGTPVAALPGVGTAIGLARQPIVAGSLFALLTMAWLFSRRPTQSRSRNRSNGAPDAGARSDVGYDAA